MCQGDVIASKCIKSAPVKGRQIEMQSISIGGVDSSASFTAIVMLFFGS